MDPRVRGDDNECETAYRVGFGGCRRRSLSGLVGPARVELAIGPVVQRECWPQK
jgi:hypothetical protein